MTSLAPNSQTSYRFSTYSGAPSIHPSIAPSNMSGQPVDSARNTMTSPPTNIEKLSAVNRSPSTTSSVDARSADIKTWAATFERMQNPHLDQQRFVVSGKKNEEIATNALGAKLERALNRRMSGQDAVFTRRNTGYSEKQGLVTAN